MGKSAGSDTITKGIRIIAQPSYMPEHSYPQERRFVFSYRIEILNQSDRSIQLLSRHWIIIDSDGNRNEVKGPGVVGETPFISPGESFSYISFCPIETSFGTMEGWFQMRLDNSEVVDIKIGRFYLASNADILLDY